MKAILKQTSWLFFAQIATRFVGFFYTIFLAGNLGVSNYGLYTVALAYFSIISSISDFGFNQFLIREVARKKMQLFTLVWNIIFLRLIFTLILFIILAVGLLSFDTDRVRVELILLAMIALLPQSIVFTFDGIFVALQKLQFSAVSLLIFSFSTTLLGITLVNLGFGTIGAIYALITGQLIYFLTLSIFLLNTKSLNLPHINLSSIKPILLGSLPYGILGAIGFISFKIDTVILSYFRGNFETGIYGVSYRFFEAVSFIPSALAAASFPIFARSLNTNLIYTKDLYFKSMKIMLLIGLGITLIYLLFLPQIMRVLLPSYISSLDLLKILSLAIPFVFLHIPSNQLLISTEKYLKQLIVVYLLLFFINVSLYLVFIPLFGGKGAAWITVLSELFTFIAFFLYINIKVFKRV